MTGDERPEGEAETEREGARIGSTEQDPEAERSRPEPSSKKAKKKKGKKDAASPEPGPLPGAGTAAGDKLREAVRAFEAGDYARVRARTSELASAADPKVRDAAAELAARVAVDPVQVVVILACAAVLAAIAYVWVF
ncbi:MAG: hypothetical protein M5U28_54570 [Sandaracinaceae bacterium]|nr:hypothetical protein [Sandaracinaceae bacterium]